ncbi:hypothetical protein BCR34DRAFT_599472 [Clohesyomyces aquaticus]|uniref:DH domain-containing protein n=1 Tax=Clohesyomyces aquaticus TaxID=1231657 RepID=A0A1Y1ZUX4_9PLEO|nr:hypothetical protein BCR34DRAFT_599472 [Clohesyomyces aquaticus]
MDPLSITASVTGVCGVSFTATKALYEFRSKYKQANLTIAAICSESSVVHAALTQIQSLLYRDGDLIIERLHERSDLAASFDISFTGCMLLYSCIEEETGRLRNAMERDGSLDWTQKLKVAWNEDTFQSLLQQLRGQETSLQLLLQTLQMESSSEMKRLLERNGEALNTIKNDTTFLRRQYPNSNVPQSIFGTRKAGTVFGDNASTLSVTEFSFDDQIVQAQAYRRVVQMAQAQIGSKPGKPTANRAESLERDDPDRLRLLPHNHEPSDQAEDATTGERKSEPCKQCNTLQAETSTPDSNDPTLIQTSETKLVMKAWSAPKRFRSFRYEQSKSVEDWATMFKVYVDVPHTYSNQNRCEFQNAWWGLFSTEKQYICTLNAAHDNDQHRRARFLSVFGLRQRVIADFFKEFDKIREANTKILYLPLLEHWESRGTWAEFLSSPLLSLAEKAGPYYIEHARALPKKHDDMQRRSAKTSKFKDGLEWWAHEPGAERLPFDHYLQAPLRRIEYYCEFLTTAHEKCLESDMTITHSEIGRVLDVFQELLSSCHDACEVAHKELRGQKLGSQLAPESASKIGFPATTPNVLMRNFLPVRMGKDWGDVPLWDGLAWHFCDVAMLDNNLIISHKPLRGRGRNSQLLEIIWISSGSDCDLRKSRCLEKKALEKLSVWPIEIESRDKLRYPNDSILIGTKSLAHQKRWLAALQNPD